MLPKWKRSCISVSNPPKRKGLIDDSLARKFFVPRPRIRQPRVHILLHSHKLCSNPMLPKWGDWIKSSLKTTFMLAYKTTLKISLKIARVRVRNTQARRHTRTHTYTRTSSILPLSKYINESKRSNSIFVRLSNRRTKILSGIKNGKKNLV